MKYLWQISTLFGLGLFITCTVLAAISTAILETSKKEVAELKMFDLDLGSGDYYIPPYSDMFVCRDFQSNFTNQARLHATKFSGVPSVKNALDSTEFVVQMVLHNCDRPVNKYISYNCADVPKGCQQILYSWSPGQGDLILPSVVGVPFGPFGYSNLMTRIHYINPTSAQLEDVSTITISLTQELRPFTAGYLLVGPASNVTNIPPGQSNYTVNGTCTSTTISSIIDGIPGKNSFKIIASTPIGHHLMTTLNSVLIRPDGSAAELSNATSFVYGYSSSVALNVAVLPGDEILTQCTYDSVGQNKTTPGGYGNMAELCFNYLMYYPAADARRCDGTSSITQLASAS